VKIALTIWDGGKCRCRPGILLPCRMPTSRVLLTECGHCLSPSPPSGERDGVRGQVSQFKLTTQCYFQWFLQSSILPVSIYLGNQRQAGSLSSFAASESSLLKVIKGYSRLLKPFFIGCRIWRPADCLLFRMPQRMGFIPSKSVLKVESKSRKAMQGKNASSISCHPEAMLPVSDANLCKSMSTTPGGPSALPGSASASDAIRHTLASNMPDVCDASSQITREARVLPFHFQLARGGF
jgi:hypothetical protein